MKVLYLDDISLYDFEPSIVSFQSEIVDGLRETPKRIASKFFYDEEGAKLFEMITELKEYYLTRTEVAIMRQNLPEIAAWIGPKAQLIEFGSGNSLKTVLLLKQLKSPAAFVPIDISRDQLIEAATQISARFDDLEVFPICADYTDEFTIPEPTQIPERSVVFFPGSTIGNFEPKDAQQFLTNCAMLVGPNGGIVIGFDLAKDASIVEPAYNDSQGITARFNKNLIVHINREFGTNLPVDNFEHYAFWNPAESRIEMHLISQRDLDFELDGTPLHFSAGEHIITEYSYKYTVDRFQSMLRKSGFSVEKTWTDEAMAFAIVAARAGLPD